MKLSFNLWPLVSRLFPVSVRAVLAGESESRYLGEPSRMKFGIVPPEPSRIADLSGCAPAFASAVQALLERMTARGFAPMLYETLRTDDRQAWLYGFGRQYDDGRGVVTHAATADNGWHKFGLAADIISTKSGWDSSAFFDALQEEARAGGLTSGSDWQMRDRPHVQWGTCRPTPPVGVAQLAVSGGLPAVWASAASA